MADPGKMHMGCHFHPRIWRKPGKSECGDLAVANQHVGNEFTGGKPVVSRSLVGGSELQYPVGGLAGLELSSAYPRIC
jgi:hypothetical protein